MNQYRTAGSWVAGWKTTASSRVAAVEMLRNQTAMIINGQCHFLSIEN
jgi:hypothetical protein